MSVEFFELVGATLTGAVGVGILSRIFRRAKPKSEPEEKRCSGYRFGRGAINMMRDDCTALRSTDCKDGRCNYHCEQMCKCLTAIWGPGK